MDKLISHYAGLSAVEIGPRSAGMILAGVRLLLDDEFEALPDAPGVARLPFFLPDSDLSRHNEGRYGVYLILKLHRRENELFRLTEVAAIAAGIDWDSDGAKTATATSVGDHPQDERVTKKRGGIEDPTKDSLQAALAALAERPDDEVLSSADVVALWKLDMTPGKFSSGRLVAKREKRKAHRLVRNNGKGWTAQVVMDTTRALLEQLYPETNPF